MRSYGFSLALLLWLCACLWARGAVAAKGSLTPDEYIASLRSDIEETRGEWCQACHSWVAQGRIPKTIRKRLRTFIMAEFSADMFPDPLARAEGCEARLATFLPENTWTMFSLYRTSFEYSVDWVTQVRARIEQLIAQDIGQQPPRRCPEFDVRRLMVAKTTVPGLSSSRRWQQRLPHVVSFREMLQRKMNPRLRHVGEQGQPRPRNPRLFASGSAENYGGPSLADKLYRTLTTPRQSSGNGQDEASLLRALTLPPPVAPARRPLPVVVGH